MNYIVKDSHYSTIIFSDTLVDLGKDLLVEIMRRKQRPVTRPVSSENANGVIHG